MFICILTSMFRLFINLCLCFAARRTVSRMDAVSMVAALAAPAWYSAVGKPMPDSATGQAAIYVFLFIAGVFLIRLLTAPYFIWADGQKKILSLEKCIDDAKSKEWSHRDVKALVQTELLPKRLEIASKVLQIGQGMTPFLFDDYKRMQEHISPIFKECRPFFDDGRLRKIIFDMEQALRYSWHYHNANDTNIPDKQRNFLANSYSLLASRLSEAAYDIIMGNGEHTRAFENLDDPRHEDLGKWQTSRMSLRYNDDSSCTISLYLHEQLLWPADIGEGTQQ